MSWFKLICAFSKNTNEKRKIIRGMSACISNQLKEANIT